MFYDHLLRPIIDQHKQIIRYSSDYFFTEYNTTLVIQQWFNDIKVCMIDEALLRHPPSRIDFELNYLTDINNSDIDVILIICDHLYAEEIRDIELLFKKPYFVLSGDTKSANSIYYPYWITTYPKGYEIDCIEKNTKFNKTFLYSCLNFHPHPHRIANLVKLYQSSYWDQCLITFADAIKQYQEDGYDFCKHPNLEAIDEFVNNGKQYFIDNLLSLLPLAPDSVLADMSDIKKLLEYNNRAYLDSYVNISMESYLDIPYITEKTTKCFLAEQFFIPYAAPGFVQYLNDLGFDTYNDIIDHRSYDSIQNHRDRMQQMHLLLDEMQYWNWPDIYKNTQDRRTANRNLILSEQITTQSVQRIKSAINTIVRS